jgi:L-threonylcarbamoyladenylate synthase
MRVSVQNAVTRLNAGDVVALPTETVYGLAASVNHLSAIKSIFTLKGRPSDNPLILHVSGVDQLKPYVSEFLPQFDQLAADFWPGSLTIVLPANNEAVAHAVRAGLPTVAARMPDHPLTLQVLAETGPLVMPSANLSGKPSSTAADHVEEDFGAEFPVLDGGVCQKGVESTILIYHTDRWVIARLGAVTGEQLSRTLGYQPEMLSGVSKPLCPGQLYKHYAPLSKLHLSPTFSCEVIVGFSDRMYPKATAVYVLGASSNPEEAARNLYRVLRQLDQDGVVEAWVDMDFPDSGAWKTIRERLKKAAGS